MSDEASDAAAESTGPVPAAAVVVGVVAGEPSRVVREAARFAKAFGADLLVVNVDVTRFVAYGDPDAFVQTASLDLTAAGREHEVERITEETAAALEGCGVTWSLHELVGDPAIAIKNFAEQAQARMIVVGTRKRGLGESIREFFTGSVAARLAHRQSLPVVVVPIGQLVADDEEPW